MPGVCLKSVEVLRDHHRSAVSDGPPVGSGGGHHRADGGDRPVALVSRNSATGAPAAGNAAAAPVPREITSVGTMSSTCWNDHCEYGADSQLSNVMPAGMRPVRRLCSGFHARATSRETIGVVDVSGVETNLALRPLIQRRQRSVSW